MSSIKNRTQAMMDEHWTASPPRPTEDDQFPSTAGAACANKSAAPAILRTPPGAVEKAIQTGAQPQRPAVYIAPGAAVSDPDHEHEGNPPLVSGADMATIGLVVCACIAITFAVVCLCWLLEPVGVMP